MKEKLTKLVEQLERESAISNTRRLDSQMYANNGSQAAAEDVQYQRGRKDAFQQAATMLTAVLEELDK